MYKRSVTMTKGVCIGVLAGATIATLGGQIMRKDKRHLKKRTNQALRSVGDIVNSVEQIFKN